MWLALFESLYQYVLSVSGLRISTISTMPIDEAYNTSVFTLSGISATWESRYFFFCITVLCYLLILSVNLTLIFRIVLRKSLHEPMYIFLCSLCLNGLYGTAGFYPKFLYDLLHEPQVISYAGCLIQVLVIYSSVLCDISILTVMAYDRFVAICRPLQYHAVMTKTTVTKLTLFSWIAPVLSMTVLVIFSAGLTLCGSEIEKLYCENWAIVRLSCSSTTIYNIFAYLVILTYLVHMFCILFSYLKLIKSSMKSIEDRRKVIQTCTPHLLSLINVTVALLFDTMYSRYGSRDFPQGLRHFLALEFLVVPPLLNPLIYGLKLSKVRNEVFRCLKTNVVKSEN
ncbi:olfactory receptor 1030-like [Scleropages formosus]|uniref:olfactory receptor 1030-like n=1 Tax=Scleropages formosus TaxID=113540 RepID=UPI0010FAA989|nr:olfactory receptor 1030-like [Scleropages formosus]